MRLHLCGVRGSTPAPGAEFAGVGGHTSCVAVAHGGATAPTLVLDAGTGIRRLPALLDGEPYQGTILLSHLHWDHVQGLPFCPAIDRPDARVRLLLPVEGDDDPGALLARGMSPPHFPIDPTGLRGDWSIERIEPGRHQLEGFTVDVVEVPHKGGRTFGFRVSDGDSSLAYVPDHGPEGPDTFEPDLLALAAGVDVLLHDAQHAAEEWAARAHFGHSSAEYAVELGVRAGVGEVVLFHHDPSRTDAEVAELAARFGRAAVPVRAAVEGAVLARGGLAPPSR